ncbi:MAG: hypothetical protein UH850_13015 [Paludibacteraceae bacterium]|nr:hypothetical protein [Paludibacteraceae bacterium]
MLRYFLSVILLFYTTLSFADVNIYDFLEGVWCTGEIYSSTLYPDEERDEDGNVITDEDGNVKYHTVGDYRTYYRLVKDKEILEFEYLRFGNDSGELEDDVTPEHIYNYQFIAINDKNIESFSNEFMLSEIEDEYSNTVVLFKKNYNKYDRVYRDNFIISDVFYGNGHWSLSKDNYKEDFKKNYPSELPYYFWKSLYEYSIKSREDYFAAFFNKKVGVYIKEDTVESATSEEDKKSQIYFVEIRDVNENNTYYNVVPLGKSDIGDGDGWIPARDIVLVSDMILNIKPTNKQIEK